MRILICLLLLTVVGIGRADGYRSVEACFVLDTTGSMSSAIAAAREKVWFIATEIVSSRQQPTVKLCLMAFRDRGDDYVTRLVPLTANIDVVHGALQQLEANGGGDSPEAVHQALFETVRDGGWSTDVQTLRVIFLIGDAPPQIYPDEPQYPEIVDAALARDIVINPVLVGANVQARGHWQRLERDTHGQMLDVPVVRTAADTKTPLDQDLMALNGRLNQSFLPYLADPAAAQDDSEPPEVSDASVLERLEFGATTDRVFHRQGDLLQDLDAGHISLDQLPPGALPATMRSMTGAEIRERLGVIRTERAALKTLVGQLLDQRRKLLAGPSAGEFELKVSQVIISQLAPGPL